MKQNTIRKTCQVVPVLLITGALAACDAHIEEPDKTVRPGHVLCVDGKAVPYSEYENSGKQAIAVVFHTYSDGETEGNGYAVYLWDMTPKAFADSSVSSRVRRRTLLHTTGMRTRSPCTIRKKRPRRWLKPFLPCGNTDRAPISPRWHRCVCCIRHRPSSIRLSRNAAGDPLPTEADECWYWTSTEVEGQQTVKAWLYSTASGTMQETPKTQAHKVRPIITINN